AGKTLTTYVWSAENILGLWEMSTYKVIGGGASIRPLAAGQYLLEFQVGGTTFYRFAFSVATMPSDDPYQPPGQRYFVEGAWNEYGNLFFQRNDPESALRFTTWLQDKSGHPTEKAAHYLVELVRGRDGRVIGRDQGELRELQHWLQFDSLLHSTTEN